MVLRRDLLSAPLGFLGAPDLALSDEPELAGLHSTWAAVARGIDEENRAYDAAEEAADRRGLDAEDCPQVAAIKARYDALWVRKRRIARAVALTPARSVAGMALKMMLWRCESMTLTSGMFEDIDGPYAFSTYRDLLRLSNLESCTEALDQKALRLLRCGHFLSGERE
ncbi:MAG TPA: hypothetical protein VG841_05040 [Caulobacterales bacterium]|nr:hypothetical protein [Caulobacterales bacterium]